MPRCGERDLLSPLPRANDVRCEVAFFIYLSRPEWHINKTSDDQENDPR